MVEIIQPSFNKFTITLVRLIELMTLSNISYLQKTFLHHTLFQILPFQKTNRKYL
jgi:hypothetical protein